MQPQSLNEMMLLSKTEQQFLFKKIEKSLKKWKKQQVKRSKKSKH